MEISSDINNIVDRNRLTLSSLMNACLHGNTEDVQDWLKQPGTKMHLQNEDSHHALMCACSAGDTEVARLLLNACPNPEKIVNLPTMDGTT